MHYRDVFHAVRILAAFDNTQVTADKADITVIDRADYPNSVLGFIWTITAAAIADASNYFELELWHADATASATALSGGVIVPDAQIFGTTRNGVHVAADHWPPRIDATAEAGDVLWYQYAGDKQYLQPQFNETGTADITAQINLVVWDENAFQNLS